MASVIETRKSRLLLLGLVLAHLVAISKQVEHGGQSLLGSGLFALVTPVQAVITGTIRGVSGGWTGYVDLRRVYEQNRSLQERVRVLESQLQARQEQAQEAERLREMLQLKKELPLDILAAEVIVREGAPWARTITVDKGSAEGVRLNAPVISATGVVGRVIAVGPHASRVQLILDGQAGVGVRIERSRVTGILVGQPGMPTAVIGDLVLKYVPSLADVVVGDVVVTSGLDHLYPAGLVVGRVRSAARGNGLFKEILVTPSAQFNTLEEVMVVRTPIPDDTMTQGVR
jgi:rod shape-determining protein MreC